MSTKNLKPGITFFSILILILVAMDVYVFAAIRKAVAKTRYAGFLKGLYWLLVLLSYAGLYVVATNFIEKPLNATPGSNLLAGFFVVFFLTKTFLSVYFLAEDIFRFFTYIFLVIKKLIAKEPEKTTYPGRRKFIRQTGLTLAAIPFGSLLYAITGGKYNFKIHRHQLFYADLPKSFEGYKIVQISDIHTGSFGSKKPIIDAVSLINDQNPDIILFTGDMVNNDSREMKPFMDELSRLKAKDGVLSVLGNHDYGEYKKWPSEEAHLENNRLLHEYQKAIGFKLLNNENVVLARNGDRLGIYGVENWGKPPFPQRGDLDQALQGAEDVPFKILMSHDPTHWRMKVLPHKTHFHLTLSGHTHGFQFGVEIPGYKWSPSQYIYPQWAGLYEKNGEYLYVNRGLGFIGFPGRAGIWPEITVIELTGKHA